MWDGETQQTSNIIATIWCVSRVPILEVDGTLSRVLPHKRPVKVEGPPPKQLPAFTIFVVLCLGMVVCDGERIHVLFSSRRRLCAAVSRADMPFTADPGLICYLYML